MMARFCYILLCLYPLCICAQPNLTFTVQSLSGPSLETPVDITGSGDGTNRLFVVERRGTIRIIENNVVQSKFFLDIQDIVLENSERGLLGLAFHPEFPSKPYFFVNYVASGNVTNIARYKVNPNDPNNALKDSVKTILTLNQPFSNHNAGDLIFDTDGYLYIPMGDGGNGGDPGNRSQNPQLLFGKLLRIDIDTDADTPYAIPSDNPFVSDAGVLDEIWAFGLRNPWRISFDSQTGDLWIADVGQNAWEEINKVPANSTGGENYGWKCWEGDIEFSSSTDCSGYGTLTFPIFSYPQDDPDDIPPGWDMGVGFSVTGGFVYRGSKWPSLQGYYVCADYAYGQVWLIKEIPNLLAAEVHNFDLGGQLDNPTSFGEGDDKELYMVGFGGTLFAVESDDPLAIESIHLNARKSETSIELNWKIDDQNKDDDQAVIHIEKSKDGIEFQSIKKFNYSDQVYYYSDARPFQGENYYRIKYVNPDEQAFYSSVKKVFWGIKDLFVLTGQNAGKIFPVQLASNSNTISLSLISVHGEILFEEAIVAHEQMVYKNLSFQHLPAGIYFLHAKDGQNKQSKRLVLH